MKDGCSILSTVGGRRFRVLSGGERDGYDTAQVELVRDSPVQPENLTNLTELHDKVSQLLFNQKNSLRAKKHKTRWEDFSSAVVKFRK